MSQVAFRTLFAELRNVPYGANMIPMKMKNKDLAQLLSTAMKALAEAENIIAKQADAILESSHQISLYLQEKCTSEFLPSQLVASTPNETIAKTLPIVRLENNSSVESTRYDSSSTGTPSCSLAANTVSRESVPSVSSSKQSPSAAKSVSTLTPGNTCPMRPAVSEDEFRLVRRRAHGKRRRMAKVATGCKRGIILGSCYRKMDVFLSRMGPEVSAEQVEDFCKDLLNDWCEVEALNARFPALYSSFRITCYTRHEEKILDPSNWEIGALIRPFFRTKSNT